MKTTARAAIAAGALIGALVTSQGFAQTAGQVYVFHSRPAGACPGLDWHVMADGSKLTGVIGWDSMAHVAKVNGSMNPNKSFQLVANEVGGNRTATINGQVRQDGWLVATVQGTGTGCDGQQINVPVWTPTVSGG